jgi:hypothetical protein
MKNEQIVETGLFHLAGASIINYILERSVYTKEADVLDGNTEIPLYEISPVIQRLYANTVIEIAEAEVESKEPLVQCQIIKTPERRCVAFIIDSSLITQVSGIPDLSHPDDIIIPHIQAGRIKPADLIRQAYNLYTGEGKVIFSE